MGVIASPPVLQPDVLTVFHTTCPILSDAPILVLYGPTTTTQSTPASSSRIQAHIFTAVGLQSYPRLAISPSSALYAAVNCLPREDQGDEVCRALAYSLFKYLSEIPDHLKEAWVQRSLAPAKSTSAMKLFTEAHAAELAGRMIPLRNSREVLDDIAAVFQTQSVSNLDLDIILPQDSVRVRNEVDTDADASTAEETLGRYGAYADLIRLFGEPAFIPTSRLRRAPSRATGINKASTLSRSQKESLRRELCEFVDTEENYVAKLYELVNVVAADFRERAKQKTTFSNSPSETALTALFPPCLDQILHLNSEFFESVRRILEETENAAIADIEASSDNESSRPAPGVDPTGAVAFAQCLLEWFPQFKHAYTAYMQASPDFAQHLRNFTNGPFSSFSKRVQETGEQRLLSLLIEPVQRLPRYSLYIDNLVKTLSIRHPALKGLLKAKDMIAEICAQEEAAGAELAKTGQRLRELVPNWPAATRVASRLITAVDLIELSPPFRSPGCELRKLIALMFADSMVFLESQSNTLAARSLVAELDAPMVQQPPDTGLIFVEAVPLTALRMVEFGDGTGIQTMPARPQVVRPSMAHRTNRRVGQTLASSVAESVRIFLLDGAYHSNASRLTKEFAKALVESRYTEAERENSRWEARDLAGDQGSMSFFSAVMEEGFSQVPRGPFGADVKIVVDASTGAAPYSPSPGSAEVVASVAIEGEGFFRLEIDAADSHRTRDLVQATEFLPVLTRRLNNLLQQKAQIRSHPSPAYLLQHYEAALKAVRIPTEKRARSPSKSRGLISQSPVKAMASFFSSKESKEHQAPRILPTANVFADITNRAKGHGKSMSESVVPHMDSVGRSPSKARMMIKDVDAGTTKVSQEVLEQAFDTYTLALHSRKGNVVGRHVSGRGVADEATVNELYNFLLEFPQDHERAAHASVDVLFAALEKFLNNAWKEEMGPLIPPETLHQMQEKAEKLGPVDYEYFLSQAIDELAPQNQRALRAMIALLIDLMEGTHNDGDRGALMAGFTEIIVQGKNAHDFMPIFDRFVEDQEILDGTAPVNGKTGSAFGSASTRTGQVSSISSKASSFSKRWGRNNISRDNSKSDIGSVSRFGSVLKSWSRGSQRSTAENPHRTLGRARSVDLVTQVQESKTSATDRPTVFGAFADSRPASSQSNTSALAKPADKPVSTPKSTRRSSLSDIHRLPAPEVSPLWSQDEINAFQRSAQKPSKLGSLGPPIEFSGSPTKSRGPGHGRDEILQVHPLNVADESPSKASVSAAGGGEGPQTPAQAQLRPLQRLARQTSLKSPSTTQVVPRGVLSERPSSGNTPPPASAGVYSTNDRMPPPPRYRAPSPTKLSNQLEQQKEAIGSSAAALQLELDKITADFDELNVARGGSVRASPPKVNPALANLTTRLRALEAKLPHHITSLERSTSKLEESYAAALKASERKARELDKQLREANATNDELFKTMDAELGRVFKAVKNDEGVEALQRALEESREEASKLRRENAKLKREVGGLRARIVD